MAGLGYETIPCRMNKAGNVPYYGGNLDVLRRQVADESVALVYLDPGGAADNPRTYSGLTFKKALKAKGVPESEQLRLG